MQENLLVLDNWPGFFNGYIFIIILNFFLTSCLVYCSAAIPGDLNFISFKNSLQECCQKQQLPVPAYTTWKNSFGYSGKVEVANNIFKSAGVQGDRKEAEQGAAYTALLNLGLIDSSVKFDVKTAAGKLCF